MRPHRSQREIVAHACTAENLYGPVDYVGKHLGCHNFNHGDLVLRSLFAQVVDDPGCLERQEARLLDFQLRLGNPVLYDPLLSERLAKGYAGSGALAHEFQGILRSPNCTHAMMDASRTETGLGNGEAAAFFSQYVAHRNAHVLKGQLAVSFIIYVAHDGEVSLDSEAGSISRHEHHTLLPVFIGIIGIGFAHDNENFTAFTSCAGDPPLAAIQDIYIAFPVDGELDVGGIGTCYIWLSHGECRANLTIEQWEQPLPLLLRRAELGQYLYITGIGSRTVKYFG